MIVIRVNRHQGFEFTREKDKKNNNVYLFQQVTKLFFIIYYAERILVSRNNLCPIQLLEYLAIEYVSSNLRRV
jgi:hypothetical protein